MAHLRPILATAVVGARRRASSSLRGMGPVLFLLLAANFGPQFLDDMQRAATAMQLGEYQHASTLFTYVLMCWSILPLLLKSGGLDRAELLKLQRFPLRRRQYFIISLVDVLANPLFLTLLVLTLLTYPIAAGAPAGTMGMLAFASFTWTVMMLMLLLHDLILIVANSPRYQRRLPLVPIIMAGMVWLSQWPTADHVLALLPAALPDHLLIQALLGSTTATWSLAAMVPVSTAAMVFGFVTLMRIMGRESGKDRKAGRDTKRRLLPAAKTATQALVRLSVIQNHYSMEPLFAWIIAAGNATYLLTAADVAGAAWLMGITLVILAHTPIAWNLFGHDGPGFLRLLTWPLDGADLVRARNLGLIVTAALPLTPMLLAGAWRFGFVSLLCGLLHATALILCLLLQGSRLSLINPSPRGFLPSGQRLSLPRLLATVFFGSILFIFSLILWRNNPLEALMLQAPLTAVLFFFWRGNMVRFGKSLEEDGPTLALHLARG